MNMEQMNVEQIEKYLREVSADYSEVEELEVLGMALIKVSVEWGDWKHSHGYLDYKMTEKGYHLLKEDVTESDGSDCYSSEHIFYHEKDTKMIKACVEMFKEKED